MKFPNWLSFYFRISTAVFAFVAAAALGTPDEFGGKVVAGDIAFWLTFAGGLQQLIFSFGGTGNQTSISLIGPVK